MCVLYQIAFWLPGVVAGISLLSLWRSGILHRPLIPATVFALGLILQSTGMMFSRAWVAGLVCQTGLAVYLLVRQRLGE